MKEINTGNSGEVRQSTPIPADLTRFKEWADRECGAWPADVQIEAFRSWRNGNLEPFKQLWALWRG